MNTNNHRTLLLIVYLWEQVELPASR